ncbi:MAG: nicotinate-nicotinamide nucleotide adenylyltransferase [Deltaproteobacteria bacterium]|nr:nicotinate-nicotinamide nucleotide adenylyltransferase [Deltaproteobacteria bacterium]
MRVAVYGGSFNPPHVGHAMVAAWLSWADQVDEVWLTPTFSHAFGKELAPFADRVAMCEALAAAVGPWVRVCPIEAALPSPSYTIDTLEALSLRHPEHLFRLVVGADVLPQTAKWRAWARIEAGYRPIAVGRVGYPEVPDAPSFPGVSSTEARDRMRAGLPVGHLLPAGVARIARDLWR